MPRAVVDVHPARGYRRPVSGSEVTVFDLEKFVVDAAMLATGLYTALTWRKQGKAVHEFWEGQYNRLPWLRGPRRYVNLYQDKATEVATLQYAALVVGAILALTGFCGVYGSLARLLERP